MATAPAARICRRTVLCRGQFIASEPVKQCIGFCWKMPKETAVFSPKIENKIRWRGLSSAHVISQKPQGQVLRSQNHDGGIGWIAFMVSEFLENDRF
jgi:hypothetical protein